MADDKLEIQNILKQSSDRIVQLLLDATFKQQVQLGANLMEYRKGLYIQANKYGAVDSTDIRYSDFLKIMSKIKSVERVLEILYENELWN